MADVTEQERKEIKALIDKAYPKEEKASAVPRALLGGLSDERKLELLREAKPRAMLAAVREQAQKKPDAGINTDPNVLLPLYYKGGDAYKLAVEGVVLKGVDYSTTDSKYLQAEFRKAVGYWVDGNERLKPFGKVMKPKVQKWKQDNADTATKDEFGIVEIDIDSYNKLGLEVLKSDGMIGKISEEIKKEAEVGKLEIEKLLEKARQKEPEKKNLDSPILAEPSSPSEASSLMALAPGNTPAGDPALKLGRF